MRGDMMARFIPSAYEEESFAKLQTLRQASTQSVDDYASDFYMLSSRVSLSEIVEIARQVEAKLKPSGYSSFTTPTIVTTSTTPSTTKGVVKPAGTASMTICYNCGKTGHMRPMEAFTSIHFPFTIHILSENDSILKSIPQADLKPPCPRAKTSATTAQRLIAHGMGLKLPSPTSRSSDFRKQEEARKKRIAARQNLRDEAWGSDETS
ncbi:hypothetical protein GIB67_042036 [Kingdonia uniflora]|uniref:CCHC-type domain-containing protein n=1 Tax=Kingdonia uniflora TaxID=39325 RepID=A0A7J7MVM0_9MAGN|nr:hypothetical protein GIB67_042036 [Kingdonia uniflora]